MTFSVNTGDLDAIAAAFGTARSDVANLRGVLTGGASEPQSASVIGSASAAGQYQAVYQEWLKNLDQLASSLGTMASKISAAARHYAQTESGNTVTAAE